MARRWSVGAWKEALEREPGCLDRYWKEMAESDVECENRQREMVKEGRMTLQEFEFSQATRDFRRRLAAGEIGEAPFTIRQRELAKKRRFEMG